MTSEKKEVEKGDSQTPWDHDAILDIKNLCLSPLPDSFAQTDYLAVSEERKDLKTKILPSNHRTRPHMQFRNRHVGGMYISEKRLREAANNGDVDTVINLINQGVNPSCADGKKRTALHFAAAKGDDKMVKVLLDHGASPNVLDSNLNTPLHLAATTSQLKVVTLLLSAGTNIQAKDLGGRSPLHLAYSRLKMLQLDHDMRARPCSYILEVQQVISLLREFFIKDGEAREKQQLDDICWKLSKVSTKEQVSEVSELLASFTTLSLSIRDDPK